MGQYGWNEAVDQLNAAQTGAFVVNLMHEVKGEALCWAKLVVVSYTQSYRLPHPTSEKKGNPRFGLEVYHDANWLERPMLPLLGTQNVYSPELSRRL